MKRPSRAIGIGAALLGSISALASCGGRLAQDDGFGSTESDDAASAEPTDGFGALDASAAWEGSTFATDGAPAFPPVDNGPSDTDPACASRPAIDCGCTDAGCPGPVNSYVEELVRGCLGDGGYVCGNVYVDFDPDGCAIALRALDPNDEFVKCATAKLDANRWTCETGGGSLRAYVDCTSR